MYSTGYVRSQYKLQFPVYSIQSCVLRTGEMGGIFPVVLTVFLLLSTAISRNIDTVILSEILNTSRYDHQTRPPGTKRDIGDSKQKHVDYFNFALKMQQSLYLVKEAIFCSNGQRAVDVQTAVVRSSSTSTSWSAASAPSTTSTWSGRIIMTSEQNCFMYHAIYSFVTHVFFNRIRYTMCR